MTENERSKERKMNGRSAISDQVKDGGKGLKQRLLQTESAITNI
jgi:hypothetical protein